MNTTLFTLITGASEGLGKALSIECAKRNMNLVLVALPGPELFHLAAYLKKNFAVQVVYYETDLSKDGSCESLYTFVQQLKLDVNVLINNAGIGNTKFFEEEKLSFFEKQIKLNVLATTTLTHCFLPILKKNAPGYILNVGSLACFFAIPKKQVYSGTKSFIYFFSRSLRTELKSENISVSVLCPGGINSNANQTMLNKSGSWISNLSLMNPEEVAPVAILGLLQKKEVIIPGKLNRLFLFLNHIVPVFVKRMIIKKQIGHLKTYDYTTRPQNSIPGVAIAATSPV
jgi:short-subunit dehydrogenase